MRVVSHRGSGEKGGFDQLHQVARIAQVMKTKGRRNDNRRKEEWKRKEEGRKRREERKGGEK
mgnify:CR=1 FL=1